MRRVPIVLAAMTLLASLAAGPATQPAGTSSSPGGMIEVLAPFVGGEWKFDGTWKSGQPLQAREVFEWGPGRRFVICRTWIATPQGEYQRYLTVFGEQDGKLMSWGFTVDGDVDVAPFTIDGSRFYGSRPIHAPDGSDGGLLHQSIELVGPNEFRWQAAIEKDGQKTQIMDGVWKREPK